MSLALLAALWHAVRTARCLLRGHHDGDPCRTCGLYRGLP